MKTSYIFAIAAIIIIGLILFFSDSADQESSSQNTPAAVESTENADSMDSSESMNADSQNEQLEVSTSDIEVTSEAALETETSQEAMPEADSTERVFTIDSFSYGYSEDEIRVKQGDTVTINLTNSGGFHDWVVDEFGAATEKISAGETTSVTFVADETGSFEYYCSVGNHREQGMVGTLIVE
jgi:plastocyanin